MYIYCHCRGVVILPLQKLLKCHTNRVPLPTNASGFQNSSVLQLGQNIFWSESVCQFTRVWLEAPNNGDTMMRWCDLSECHTGQSEEWLHSFYPLILSENSAITQKYTL